MTVAAPHLYEALRGYCLAAFARSPPTRSKARSRSWSTSEAASTSTGRSCATISRIVRTSFRSFRTRGSRSTSCAASRRPRSSCAAPPTGPAPPGRSSTRSCCRCSSRPARPAAGSTGRTVRSTGCTARSNTRCSAPVGRTRRRRRSSASRPEARSSWPAASVSSASTERTRSEALAGVRAGSFRAT